MSAPTIPATTDCTPISEERRRAVIREAHEYVGQYVGHCVVHSRITGIAVSAIGTPTFSRALERMPEEERDTWLNAAYAMWREAVADLGDWPYRDSGV